MQQALDPVKLHSPPAIIAGWGSWSPHLKPPQNVSALVMRALDAGAFMQPKGVTLVNSDALERLATCSWRGIDTFVRELCFERIKSQNFDGHLMRARLSSLYPRSMSFGSWEELFRTPSTITVRSQLMENTRIILFYATVLALLGHEDLVSWLKPLLDLAQDGYLPLGIAHSDQKLLLVTG